MREGEEVVTGEATGAGGWSEAGKGGEVVEEEEEEEAENGEEEEEAVAFPDLEVEEVEAVVVAEVK
jgi:hypothetical protein